VHALLHAILFSNSQCFLLQSRRVTTSGISTTARRQALGLLLFINLFCYLDRYVLAAVVPALKEQFLAGDPHANEKAGWLSSAFLISYMLMAPLFGWMADRFSRWVIIGLSVALWSLASGASGLAAGFAMLLMTRVFLGIGEAGYGPAAPTIISDLYPVEKRGAVLAWFFMAIPVGSALGYVFGGMIEGQLGWRWAFYLVAPPGLLLALLCFFMRDPRHAQVKKNTPVTMSDYKRLAKIPSLLTNIAAQAAMTFAIGGMSFWAPTFIHEQHGIPLAQVNLIFGGITAFTGLISTLLGGWLGDRAVRRLPAPAADAACAPDAPGTPLAADAAAGGGSPCSAVCVDVRTGSGAGAGFGAAALGAAGAGRSTGFGAGGAGWRSIGRGFSSSICTGISAGGGVNDSRLRISQTAASACSTSTTTSATARARSARKVSSRKRQQQQPRKEADPPPYP